MNETPLIRLEDIHKTYHNGNLSVGVLHGISLDIRAGEFVAIMGASGSGKSTLMNILGCLDDQSDGQYFLDGEDVSSLDPDDLAALRRRTFGFIFQNYSLIAASTAQENVEVPAIYAGVRATERHDRAAELLDALNLGDRLDHRPNQLSGGQQQRVSIARALMNGGRIILADEPTGALDSQSGKDVMDILRSMHRQGHTIIVITHAREVAEQADRLIEIRDGRILSDTVKRDIPDPAAAQRLSRHVADKDARIADVSEAVKMAVRALRANIFRTILTLLGVIIGVSSVVTMLAIGTGAQNSILDKINAMGTDLVMIRPSMPGFRGTGGIATLVPEDADAILQLPNVKSAVPEVMGAATLRRGNIDYISQTDGTAPAFQRARAWKVASGDFITDRDVENYAPVAVIGATIVKTLFPDGSNPIGQYILIQKIPFQVIGVMEPKGASNGGDQDDLVIVPISTSNLRLLGQKFVHSITVQVKNSDLINATQDQIQELLDKRHNQRDTMIANMSSIRDEAAAMTKTLTMFLGSIAAISLVVGGIGIMNIMLVSVSERTREIGVRMATGARKSDILTQFIIESLTVSTIGGIIGTGLGLGLAALLSLAGAPVSYGVEPVLLALGCALTIGLVFGILPARKASNLQPARALSSE